MRTLGLITAGLVIGLLAWRFVAPKEAEPSVEALSSQASAEVVEPQVETPSRPEVSVVVLTKDPPRSVGVEGSCFIKGEAGEEPVRSVHLSGRKIWACTHPLDGTRPNKRSCVWRQRLSLGCASPSKLTVKGKEPRIYGKTLEFTIRNRALRILTQVDLEDYVDSVVLAEHRFAPFEAQRAQAILARTYLMHALGEPRHDDAPVCDHQHCQAYTGSLAEVDADSAARSTEGFVLVASSGKLAPTFFHSNCAGHTLDAASVWPGRGIRGIRDIRGVKDVDSSGRPWCRNRPSYRWSYKAKDRRVARALRSLSKRALHAPSLRLKSLDQLGLRWQVRDRRGSFKVKGSQLHRELGRAFGFVNFRSARFSVRRTGRTLSFIGQGMGHGVGLCQSGAAARAKAGQRGDRILRAYFPRFSLKLISELE